MLAHVARFDPEFVILQCGADSIAGDPITHLQLSTACHARAARELCALADRLGHGRVLALGGGGYDRGNLARAWSAVVQVRLLECLMPADPAAMRVQFGQSATPHCLPTQAAAACFPSRMRIKDFDPELQRALDGERQRQEDPHRADRLGELRQPAVLEAQGSVLTNKYAEGYPGQALLRRLRIRRHAEQLAIDRAKKLFGPTTPTCSRIRARRPMPRSIWRCCLRAM